MICPKCRAYNEDNNVFCINCGETFNASEPQPTLFVPGTIGDSGGLSNPSQPTVVGAHAPRPAQPFQQLPAPQNFDSSFGAFQQSFPPIPPAAQRPQSRVGLYIGLSALLLILIAGGVAALLFFADFKPKTSEALPGNLGLFFQNADKSKVTEIKKFDYRDGAVARDELKDETAAVLDPRPNLILYSDGKDIPVSELRLIEVESIKDDGTVKQIEFKAATVDGKPEMKRIWVTEDLAPGKYAFAIFDGYFEDGKHHFWPFEVKGGTKKDNSDLARAITIGRRSKAATPTPKSEKTPEPEKKVEPPKNTTVAYSNTGNVVLRSGPSQSAAKIGTVAARQKLYVIEYSDNWETFVTKDGREMNSNYAYVQTESGRRGWVYAAFIK